MRGARAGGLAAVLMAAVCLTGTAAGKTQPSTTYVDKAAGYRISIPTAWKLVPRSKAQFKPLIAQLKKKKQTALADTYSSILASPGFASALKAYRFQAFAWPPISGTPIMTEVSVGVVKTSKALKAKDLPAIGVTYAKALASNKGSKVATPKRVKLPAGAAELIEGTVPAGSGVSNGIELYLIPHGKRLYEISFQIDAQLLRQATLFTSIAKHFRFA